jgi:hypothetical protein
VAVLVLAKLNSNLLVTQAARVAAPIGLIFQAQVPQVKVFLADQLHLCHHDQQEAVVLGEQALQPHQLQVVRAGLELFGLLQVLHMLVVVVVAEGVLEQLDRADLVAVVTEPPLGCLA